MDLKIDLAVPDADVLQKPAIAVRIDIQHKKVSKTKLVMKVTASHEDIAKTLVALRSTYPLSDYLMKARFENTVHTEFDIGGFIYGHR